MNSLIGRKITVSTEAYKMVPIFPDKKRTKRRNRRTIGRFGRLDRMQPMAYETPYGIVAHPLIYSKLRAMRDPNHERLFR